MVVSEQEGQHTFPDERGKCFFCGNHEDGYSKKDDAGVFRDACWPCINKERVPSAPQKRQVVGTVFTEDLDTEDKISKKAKGLAPSTHRPKTN